jgi:hypothetical protein
MTQIIFISLTMMAVLVYPIYYEMASTDHCHSKATYSVHILAGSFSFLLLDLPLPRFVLSEVPFLIA